MNMPSLLQLLYSAFCSPKAATDIQKEFYFNIAIPISKNRQWASGSQVVVCKLLA